MARLDPVPEIGIARIAVQDVAAQVPLIRRGDRIDVHEHSFRAQPDHGARGREKGIGGYNHLIIGTDVGGH